MIRYKVIHTLVPLLCAVAMLAMHACTVANLDLCMDGHPHKGQLIVTYDWSGISGNHPDSELAGGEHPDSMVVVALRPVFRDKVASNWAADKATGENRLYGRFIASASEEDDLYYNPYTDIPSRDSIILPAGEWEITSYTSNRETIASTERYTKDLADEGSELFFRQESFDRLPAWRAYWYDRNSYYSNSSTNSTKPWVDVPLKSSICLARGTVIVDEYSNDRKEYKVTLKPQSVSQKINMSFEAKVVDDDITVDSVVCAISGIPKAMNIHTMELDIDTTHQAIFRTERLSTTTADGNIRYGATLHVLGIVRSSSASLLQGPGILNVSVFVHYTDDKGIRRARRLDATVNLFRLLTENPSVKYNDGGKVVQVSPELDMHVRSTMLISKSKLSNADDALDAWVDETIIEAGK